MERLNRIENQLDNEAEDENQAQFLRESEIRQQMRIDHARRLLALGVDAQIIANATDLRVEFVDKLRDGDHSE